MLSVTLNMKKRHEKERISDISVQYYLFLTFINITQGSIDKDSNILADVDDLVSF